MGVHAHSLTITSGQTTSPALNVEGRAVVGISIGTVAATAASFTAATTAPSTPKGEGAAGTFRTVRDSAGVALSFTTTDDSHIVVDPAAMCSFAQLKIVANVAASGDETWIVLTRPVD